MFGTGTSHTGIIPDDLANILLIPVFFRLHALENIYNTVIVSYGVFNYNNGKSKRLIDGADGGGRVTMM